MSHSMTLCHRRLDIADIAGIEKGGVAPLPNLPMLAFQGCSARFEL